MADAALILLAKALVTAMKTVTWTIAFVPALHIRPSFETISLDHLEVCVVPGGATWEFTSRGPGTVDEPIIDIGFQRKVKNIDEDVPPLLLQVESVVSWLKQNRTISDVGGVKATIVKIENTPIYDVNKLHGNNTFLSVLRLTLRRTS